MQKKPMFLNLFQIRFPLTAIVSILHRISGLIMFIAIPLMLWLLETSLDDVETFLEMEQIFKNTSVKFFLLLFITPFIYHTIAGIRHMIMDFGYFESKAIARITSMIVFILSVLVMFFIGIHIW